MKIAVAGTGYVGLSIATLLAQHNEVMAVDIIPEKVEMINKRISPIQDEYIEKYFAEKELNLTATLDAEVREAVAEGQRRAGREKKLVARREELRLHDEREGEVLPCHAQPSVATLSASCRLPFGPQHVAMPKLRIACQVVGRTYLFKAINHR